jgi:chromosome segregation ATPase
MCKKYLHEEEMVKRGFDLENKKLNEELENLGKMTDEMLKQKIKEKEKNESVLLSNTITNNELKWNLLLNRFKDEEQFAKDLLEERTQLNQKLLAINEDINNQANLERDHKYDLIDLKNNIQETQIQIEDNKVELDTMVVENDKLRKNNAKFEHEILGLRYKIDELKQKVELNAILKDVDIDELKQLTQNNAMVNNSISNLMSKWDTAYTKLQEMEKSKEF